MTTAERSALLNLGRVCGSVRGLVETIPAAIHALPHADLELALLIAARVAVVARDLETALAVVSEHTVEP